MNKLFLILIFVMFLVLPNPESSYAELDFGVCGGDCMLVKPPYESNELKDIFFNNEEDVEFTLSDISKKVLKEMAEKLKNNPLWVIEIQGHADVLGKDRNYALALGERRAQTVKAHLTANGVNARRLHTISYGKEKLFCTEPSEECRRINNRVHFRLVR